MTELSTDDRNDLHKGDFAFPKQRKELLGECQPCPQRHIALQSGEGRHRRRAGCSLEADRGGSEEVRCRGVRKGLAGNRQGLMPDPVTLPAAERSDFAADKNLRN